MAISLLNAGPATVVAEQTDLPYALVTRTTGSGAWEFVGSGVQDGVVYSVAIEDDGGSGYNYTLLADDRYVAQINRSTDSETEIDFFSADISATRPYANGAALLDRASNAVSVSSNVTLALPSQVQGRLRDFILDMTVTASSASVSFSAQTAPTYVWYGTPSKSYAQGRHVLRFTEVAENVFSVLDVVHGNRVDASQVYAGTLEAARIPGLNASKITAGTLEAGRIPGLSALKITSGIFNSARIPTATTSGKGGVIVDGSTITISDGVISVPSVVGLEAALAAINGGTAS